MAKRKSKTVDEAHALVSLAEVTTLDELREIVQSWTPEERNARAQEIVEVIERIIGA